MYDKKKKFRRSPVTVICFVLAALMLIYACYQGGSTIHQINDYYAQYGMKAKPAEYLTYVSQAVMATLINAIVLFMLAKIHDDVRKNNPANYQSDEDIVEAGIAKKEARDAKKFEKGEKAAAKAGHTADTEAAVVADFTTAETEAVTEKETPKKPAAKKSTAKKPAAKKTDQKKTSDEKDGSKKTAAKKPAPRKKAAPKKADADKKNEAEKQDNKEKQEKTEE